MFKNIFDSTRASTFVYNTQCFLGNSIPGKNITKSLGLISMVTKGIAGDVNKEFEKLIQNFVEKVEELGGNAVINLHFETGSYQQQGSAWITTYILIYGEGVVAN